MPRVPLVLLTAILCFPGLRMVQGDTKAAPDRPNFLFILIDDLGKEWVSCYGAEGIETPHIDALAAGGMKFNNAYAMPQCTPSRATLLTGTYPFRNGYTNHWDVPRWGVGYFDWKQPGNMTFARRLKELGYATCAAGKWQINDFRLEPQAMKKHGFDDWAMWTGYESGNPPSAERYQNAYINTPAGSARREGKFGPDEYTQHLIRFMREHRDEPMCLYFPMALTHGPLVPTPDHPKAASPRERHIAMVTYCDKMIGQLVAALDELGLRQRTFVIVTTDNGTGSGLVGKRNGQAVKGAKAKNVEAGVCVPYVVNCPGRVPAGVETDALTDFSDLTPTLVDLAGGTLPTDAGLDGVSIAPVLLGTSTDSTRSWILAMGHGPGRVDEKGVRGRTDFADRVIRDKTWKVWINENRTIDKLFNLEKDPWEKDNLLPSDSPEAKAALAKFQRVLDGLPKEDARPAYTPRAPNPWDQKPRAKI